MGAVDCVADSVGPCVRWRVYTNVYNVLVCVCVVHFDSFSCLLSTTTSPLYQNTIGARKKSNALDYYSQQNQTKDMKMKK